MADENNSSMDIWDNEHFNKAWNILLSDEKMVDTCSNILYRYMEEHKLISEKGNVESSDLQIVLDLLQKIGMDLYNVTEIFGKNFIPF